MIKTNNGNYLMLVAEENKIIINKIIRDGAVCICLGIYDTEENYIEISINENE